MALPQDLVLTQNVYAGDAAERWVSTNHFLSPVCRRVRIQRGDEQRRQLLLLKERREGRLAAVRLCLPAAGEDVQDRADQRRVQPTKPRPALPVQY